MKKRIYLKSKRPKKKKTIKQKLFISLAIFLPILIISLYFCSKKIEIALKDYSELETERFLDTIINSLVKNKVLKESQTKDIIEIYKNKNGDILYADFNDEIVNEVLSSSIEMVQSNLIAIENGKIDNLSLPSSIYSKYNKLDQGIIVEIPTGSLINNALFANIGPKIPMRLQLLGGIKGNVKTDIKEYGINNSLISIKIVIEVTEQVVLPISTNKVKVATEIPITTKIIQGKIPTYYQNGLTTNSPIFSTPTN